MSHGLGCAGWPSPSSPPPQNPHPRAGLTSPSQASKPVALPATWTPPTGRARARRSPSVTSRRTSSPARVALCSHTTIPPPPLLLPADQPGAQQRLPAAIILLTWSLRTALSPAVSLESKPFPSLAQFCPLWGSGLHKATAVLFPTQARPLRPYFKPSTSVNRKPGGLISQAPAMCQD